MDIFKICITDIFKTKKNLNCSNSFIAFLIKLLLEIKSRNSVDISLVVFINSLIYCFAGEPALFFAAPAREKFAFDHPELLAVIETKRNLN